MPIHVACPTCRKELAAPDELAGRVAECPYCQGRVHVPGGMPVSAGTATVRMPVPAARSTADSEGRKSARPATAGKETISMRPAAPGAPPQPAPAANSASFPPVAAHNMPPIASPLARSNSAPAFMPPPISTGAQAPPEPPPAARPAKNAASSKSTARRRMNRAVFKTGDTAKSQVHLGADGRLPELVLEEGPVKERPIEERKGTNPLVLVAVLGISIGMSVLMLLVDTESAHNESRSKAEARETIATRYLGGDSPAPYQVLLREAQQAHARGNDQVERARYRRVLDMLHAEGKNKYEGLTGVSEPAAGAASGPNDRELERLLSILLSAD